MKRKVEHGFEDYTYCSSDIDYELSRQTKEGLKATRFGRHDIDEDLNMYFRKEYLQKKFSKF